MNVENILQSKGAKVFTISGEAKIAEAIRVLNSENIGAVVVVDAEDQVVGIMSERDVIRQMGGDSTAVLFSPVSGCMTRNLITCTPETSLDELMQLMTARRIRHVPVLRNGQLAGLVSIGDVVKRKIEKTEEEAAAMREYIAS
ncbi:CBS domain-containing protein [Mariluticola halotolerans]|uniref:CBS domain-containing protein n=1 Tax=Mariluticola halotolerans TaxID=2909283 RepID=UPI0026E4335B|nr:CBS domain-containing protein [Mariluticola halotolerans]UJQ94479.1 CBS domain-containing protein [Mariluticola halotolerans]